MADRVTAELISKQELAPGVREFVWRRTDGARWEYQTGQYINIVLDDGSRTGERITRAYSICAAPDSSDTIRFVANLVPDGAGTPILFAFEPGAQVSLSQPKGSFVLNEASTRRCLFVATGTGIGPLRAMIQRIYETKPEHEATLLWGLRSEDDRYYFDEFTALATQYANFHFYPCLSQASEQWTGRHGRVTEHSTELVTSVENLEAYLCGNEAMIEEVRAYLKTLGLCPVRTEKFY